MWISQKFGNANTGEKTGLLLKSMRKESMMQVISTSGIASGGSQTKAFSTFPPGRIRLLTPWLAVTQKCHIPADTIFSSQEGGSSAEEISLVSSL